MTDSDGNGGGGGLGLEARRGQPAPDKRQRLVEGGRLLRQREGGEKTTLADIAQAADVPVGNVYYYFKTKDELVRAAIDAQAQAIETTLASLDHHRSPKARVNTCVK